MMFVSVLEGGGWRCTTPDCPADNLPLLGEEGTRFVAEFWAVATAILRRRMSVWKIATYLFLC